MYKFKLRKLESEFVEVRENLKKLRDNLPEKNSGNKGFDKSLVKLRLDIAIGLVRIIKEHAAFYLKLGESYDLAKLVEDICLELEEAVPDHAEKILKTIHDRWKLEIPESDKEPKSDNSK